MANLDMVRQLLDDLAENQDMPDNSISRRVNQAKRELEEVEKNLRLLTTDRTHDRDPPRKDRPTTWDVLHGPSYEFT